jgi:hypothetical protein
MSIADNLPMTPPPPVDVIANTLAQQARNCFYHLDFVFNEGTTNFWANPKATPQEIAAALGPKAADFLAFYNKLGAFLDAAKPGTPARGSTADKYTANDDGTVTIHPTPPPSPTSLL